MLAFWIIVGAITTIFLLWLGSGVLEAWLDFKRKPKKPLFWCHQHGAFEEKHVIKFLEAKVCPRCYWNAWQKADGK